MRRAKSRPSMARWSDDSIWCGAHVESRTPSAVTTQEQLRLNACRSSRASVWLPCQSTLVAMSLYLEFSIPADPMRDRVGLALQTQEACHRLPVRRLGC